jgi:hypothetical protein
MDITYQPKRVLKTNCTSIAPSSGKSVQWTPFMTLSIPKQALKLFGSNFFAI